MEWAAQHPRSNAKKLDAKVLFRYVPAPNVGQMFPTWRKSGACSTMRSYCTRHARASDSRSSCGDQAPMPISQATRRTMQAPLAPSGSVLLPESVCWANLGQKTACFVL